jgi:hypothetical protein
MTSFPIPGRVKAPVFLVSETAKAATSSRIAAEVFFVSSNFPAKWDTIWALVMGFLAIFSPPFRIGNNKACNGASILERDLEFKPKIYRFFKEMPVQLLP